MFSQRNLQAVSLGSLGLGCAIVFNACAPTQVTQNPGLGNQAVAIAQPAMTGAELNERLLSVLPPLDNTEITEAAAQTWNEDGASASNTSPAISLANPEPVPTTQTVAPEPQTPAPLAPPLAAPVAAIQAAPAAQSQAIAFNRGSSNTQYGHYPYSEAYRDDLTLAGYYGSRPEQLHPDAAKAFQAMQAAAKRDGVKLMAVSGFRDVRLQEELFFAQTARQGSPELAARISAPPGYSEHHTGFAIDVGDEDYPNTDIEVSFEQTPGFHWMAQNAAAYGFELSFPRNNVQGVSYEPWHWRFIGTATAQQTFAQAR